DKWKIAFKNLLTRDAFPLDRQSFAFDSTEVLGIALGCAAICASDDFERREFAGIVARCFGEGNQDFRSQTLYNLAMYLLIAEDWTPRELLVSGDVKDIIFFICLKDVAPDLYSIQPEVLGQLEEQLLRKV